MSKLAELKKVKGTPVKDISLSEILKTHCAQRVVLRVGDSYVELNAQLASRIDDLHEDTWQNILFVDNSYPLSLLEVLGIVRLSHGMTSVQNVSYAEAGQPRTRDEVSFDQNYCRGELYDQTVVVGVKKRNGIFSKAKYLPI